MAYRLARFAHPDDYAEWLHHAGDTVRIVSAAATRQKWSLASGFFTNSETFTVTYEVLSHTAPDPGRYQVVRARERSRAVGALTLFLLLAAAVAYLATRAR